MQLKFTLVLFVLFSCQICLAGNNTANDSTSNILVSLVPKKIVKRLVSKIEKWQSRQTISKNKRGDSVPKDKIKEHRTIGTLLGIFLLWIGVLIALFISKDAFKAALKSFLITAGIILIIGLILLVRLVLSY